MTGWRVERACFEACLFGELSQHNVAPHSWQVLRCTQSAPIRTHSAHSRLVGCLTSVVAAMCEQAAALIELLLVSSEGHVERTIGNRPRSGGATLCISDHGKRKRADCTIRRE